MSSKRARNRKALLGSRLLLTSIGILSFGVAGAAAAPSSPDPAGFRRVSVAKAGFSVEIPESWLVFDFTKPSVPARYRQFRRENPGALTIPPNLSTFASQTQLYASDPTWPNEIRVELVRGMTSLPSSRQLRALLDREPAAVRPDIEAIHVDGQPAIRTIRRCVVTPPGGSAVCAGSQSVMVATSTGVLTFEFGFDPARPGGPTATALTHTVSQGISLQQKGKR